MQSHIRRNSEKSLSTLRSGGYLHDGETCFEDVAARVARVCSLGDAILQEKIMRYMIAGYFCPATPILMNAGRQGNKNRMISCFLMQMQDDMGDIKNTIHERMTLAEGGGGVAVDVSKLRSLGNFVSNGSKTAGALPFVKLQDACSLAISQGNFREGSGLVSMHVSHPEIYEFLDMIDVATGSSDLSAKHLKFSVAIDDAFMRAVEQDDVYALRDPHTKLITKEIQARDLMSKILDSCLEWSKPYIYFIDNANKAMHPTHKAMGLTAPLSNLCHEIILPVNETRSAVCCLGSLNLEMWDEYKDNIEDVVYTLMSLLDNVITITCDQIRDEERSILEMSGSTEEGRIIRTRKFSNWAASYKKILHSMESERSIGMGVMGWHAYLQSKNLAFCDQRAEEITEEIFKAIKKASDVNNKRLAQEKGACQDDPNVRHMYTMAIAPTASISAIMDTSASIRPNLANAVKDISPAGEIIVKNKYLNDLLAEKAGVDDDAFNNAWSQIIKDGGSVKNVTLLKDYEKSCYYTPFEFHQMFNDAILRQAIIRQQYIDQAQSVDFFYDPASDAHGNMKGSILRNVLGAWRGGLKTIYYHYSSHAHKANRIQELADKAECLGCA